MIEAPADESALPLAVPLPAQLTAVEAFTRLAHLAHMVFFDSASAETGDGRYSFVAADPFEWFAPDASVADPLAELTSRWQQYACTSRGDLPPFQGGVAGLFAFDLAQTLERLPSARQIDFPLPPLAVGLYDVVLAFDHAERCGWLVSQGLPETEPRSRTARAAERANQFLVALEQGPRPFPRDPHPPLAPAEIAPQFDCGLAGVTSNLSARDYLAMVTRAVEYIHAGDVFQVNLAQRLLRRAQSDPRELYLKLRRANPAPYAGFLNVGDWQICSTSPECFLRLQGNNAETRPIKGTRGRSSSPEADLFTGSELRASEKDRAENVMIVDLLRNDFSRVCTPQSVQVAELCQVQSFAHVKHLVSVVRGELRDECGAFDLLRACFPGGSITGAPKVRALEIIAELEPTARGAYCGSLGYIGFNGTMDSSILIRTVTAGRGWWQLPVGGGIVAQSDPDDEYRETWHKARGLVQSLL